MPPVEYCAAAVKYATMLFSLVVMDILQTFT